MEFEMMSLGTRLPDHQRLPGGPMIHDPVNHPSHYTNSPARCDCGQRVECITVVEHMAFNVGNAVKYLWRHVDKDDPIQDLKKARWYVDREIERLGDAP